MGLFSRRFRIAERKSDQEQMERCARLWWSSFARAKRLFDEPDLSAEISPLLAAELRNIGLL